MQIYKYLFLSIIFMITFTIFPSLQAKSFIAINSSIDLSTEKTIYNTKILHLSSYPFILQNIYQYQPTNLDLLQFPLTPLEIFSHTRKFAYTLLYPIDWNDISPEKRAMIKASAYSITLLSHTKTPPKATVDSNIDMQISSHLIMTKLTTQEFLSILASLWRNNYPIQHNYSMLLRTEYLGANNGKYYNSNTIPPEVQEVFENNFSEPKTKITTEKAKLVKQTNSSNWAYITKNGTYGVDYLYRSVAFYYLYSLLPENYQFILYFNKKKSLPIIDLWTTGTYNHHNEDDYFNSNLSNRNTIQDRDIFTINNDDSADISIQMKDPQKEKNWLPFEEK